MDVRKYIPVGKDNAVVVLLLMTGAATLTGAAWLEADDATEVTIQSQTEVEGRLWVVGADTILALTTTAPPTSASAAQPAAGG